METWYFGNSGSQVFENVGLWEVGVGISGSEEFWGLGLRGVGDSGMRGHEYSGDGNVVCVN